MILERRCVYCHGQGTVPDPHGVLYPRAACPVCQGRRFNLIPQDATPCSFCHASGQVQAEGGGAAVCPDCRGLGATW